MEIATLDFYQQLAEDTLKTDVGDRVVFATLGLNGEAGEVAEKVKKIIRDNNGNYNQGKCREIAKELGDVLWYCAVLARAIGYDLSDIASMNIEKIQSRQERGKIHGSGDNR